MGSATWTSTHQGQSGYSYSGVPNLPAAETNTQFLIPHHSLAWLASYLVASWLQWTTTIMEGAVLCSHCNKYSWYGFAFPECNVSAETTIHGLTECLIHHHGVPYSFPLRGLPHSKGLCDNGPMHMDFTSLTVSLIILKQLPWKNGGMAFWKLSHSAI